MKKRVGERIQEEISEFYANEVLLPTTLVEYDQGFNEMILLNKAHAIMLMEAQIIEKQAAEMILEGLDRVWRELKREDLDGAYEELYFNVQKSLFERIGIETGGKLHTGRSRNDIYATLTRMEVRRSLWEVMQRLIDLQQVLTEGAAADIDTVITGSSIWAFSALFTATSSGCKMPTAARIYHLTDLQPWRARVLPSTGSANASFWGLKKC
jgi:argininosuccinate lyase